MTQGHIKLLPKVLLVGTIGIHCANDSDDPSSRRSTDTEGAAETTDVSGIEGTSPYTDAELNALGLGGSAEVQRGAYLITVPASASRSTETRSRSEGAATGPVVGDAKILDNLTASYSMKAELFRSAIRSAPPASGSARSDTSGQEFKLEADFDQLPVLSISVAGGMNRDTLKSLEKKGYIVSPVVKMKPVGMPDLQSIGFQRAPSFQEIVPQISSPYSQPIPQSNLPKVAIIDLATNTQTLPMKGRSLQQFDCANNGSGATGQTCQSRVAQMKTTHGTDVTSIVHDMIPLEIGLLVFNIFPKQQVSGSEPTTNSSYALTALNLVLCMKKRWNNNERGDTGLKANPLCVPRNILAVNLSFSTDETVMPAPCNTTATSFGLGGPGGVMEQLRTAGISVVAAAGNGRTKIGLPVPACISGTFSVGVKSKSLGPKYPFSIASYLQILAPGEDVIVAGGAKKTGTSFAAPFVTGALAILGTANPSWKPAQREDRLKSLGKIKQAILSRSTLTVTVPTLSLDGRFWQ
jgi:hypothetical protein